MLPELPVAGPSNSGPPCPSSSYLYSPTIVEEANYLLSSPSNALAQQLSLALSQTAVDGIMLNTKNVSAFTNANPPPMTTASTSHLQSALYRRDQAMWQPLNSQQQLQVQQHWNSGGGRQPQSAAAASTASSAGGAGSNTVPAPEYSPGHTFSHNSPNAAQSSMGSVPQGFQNQAGQQMTTAYSGYNQQFQQQQQQQLQGGYSQGTTAAAAAPSSGVNQHQVQQPQPQQPHSGLSSHNQQTQMQPAAAQHSTNLPQSQSQTAVHKYEPKSTNGDMMQTQANKVTAPSQQQQQQQTPQPQAQQQVQPQKPQVTSEPAAPKEFSFDFAVSKTMEVKAKIEEDTKRVAKIESNQPATTNSHPVVANHATSDMKSGDTVKLEQKPTKIALQPSKNNVLKPMLMLNKMSKEDAELMQKSLKDFAKHNPERAQNLLNPVRSSRRRLELSDGGSSDSDSDNQNNAEPKKLKSKFFRATEKERNEVKEQARDERRKRRAEEEAADPSSVGKRRRERSPEKEESEELKPFVPIKITRKVERLLVPKLMKIDPNELADSGTFSRFNRAVELIFDNMEDVNMKELEESSIANDGNIELPEAIIINKYQLKELAEETAKLKSMGAMESISVERLVKILTILELNIRDGAKVVPIANDDEDEEDDTDFVAFAMDKVMRGADASLTVLNIMTSKKMSKRVYLDDVIDRVALFLRFQVIYLFSLLLFDKIILLYLRIVRNMCPVH